MGALPITASGTAEPLAHGGDLGAIRRRFPEAPEPWIDLSTGINLKTAVVQFPSV